MKNIYAIFYPSGAWRVEKLTPDLAEWVKNRDPHPVMILKSNKGMVATKYQLFAIMRRMGIEPV